MATNPVFTNGIYKLFPICQVIFKDRESSHSIFSTLEELESPVIVLDVLKSFSNFNFHYASHMVCTTCYGKTIQTYKFIKMCDEAYENMQQYFKHEKEMRTRKDSNYEEVDKMEDEIINSSGAEETNNNEEINISHPLITTEEETDSSDCDLRVEVETINTEMLAEEMVLIKCKDCRLLFIDKNELADHRKKTKHTDGREFVQEVTNEERILQEGMEKEETINNEESSIYVNEEETDSSDFDNPGVEKLDAQIHDDRMDLIISKDCHLVSSDKKEMGDHRGEAKLTKEKPIPSDHETDVVCPESPSNSHTRVHSGDPHNEVNVKAHRCEECDRRFTQASNLRSRMVIHNGIKAHKCEQCDRRFADASSLRSHMKMHTGVCHMDMHNGVKEDKRHKCEQCDCRFPFPSDLRRHMIIHDGVKPYKCEQCDRRFIQAGKLRTHMEIHKGVKAHKCEQCDRQFTRASNLRKHMVQHNRELPYNCSEYKCTLRSA